MSEDIINDKGQIVVDGVVIETLPGGFYQIKLTTDGFEGHELRAKLSGKMRMNYIRIVLGDRVQITIPQEDPDLSMGRITYRYKA